MNWQFHTGHESQVGPQMPSKDERLGPEELLPAGAHVFVPYESEAERDELLSRLSRVGLGQVLRVVIDLGPGKVSPSRPPLLRKTTPGSSRVVGSVPRRGVRTIAFS